eukprot:3544193-Pyramimonas_sp.AAC.1
MGQMIWPMVLAHADQMQTMAEDERASGHGPALAFVYDELFRKSIASSAECDPSLDVIATFSEVDKQVLEAARTRLNQT